MVDLRKVRGAMKDSTPLDPRRIFDRQPKPEGVNDLWESQGDVLRAWHERRLRKDIVIKLNTGGGKTLVGLLIAQSLMNELKLGALYLCATNQLVDQTVSKAAEFQLPVVRYQTGPGPLPSVFLNGDATLIATYRALFHGFSKFHVRGSGAPIMTSGIICDDAHTAFADVRSSFSIVISKARSESLYREIAARFRDGAASVNRLGTYDQRVGGIDLGVFEVPYWTWRDQANGVRDLLRRHIKGSEYEYQFPLVADYFDAAHVLVRALDITITPVLPPVDILPTFSEAPRRVFMSATIADDSSLVRTFDIDPAAVRNPIAPASLAGVGERLIIAPALTGVGTRHEVDVSKELVHNVAERALGVVILTASEKRATYWKDVGKVVGGDGVASAVEALVDRSSGDNGPYVFANRYDGIDLAKDSCRLLIMDGLPQGASAYDEYRATVLRGSSQIELSIAQRVEQGLGRGTRGAGDYCVVLLVGSVVDWVSRRANVALMTAATRAQLELGLEVSKTVTDSLDLFKAADLCLNRDTEWVGLHAKELAERTELPTGAAEAVARSVDDAVIERAYAARLLQGDYKGALAVARDAAKAHSEDRLHRGWLLQLAARAAFYVSQGTGSIHDELQLEAVRANPALISPSGRTISEALPPVLEQGRALAEVLESYDQREGFIGGVQRSLLNLTGTVSYGAFEEAIRALGHFLGFDSEKIDRGTGLGPDNTWRTSDNEVFVISCKNEKGASAPLHKKDLQQLLIDAKWIEENQASLKQTPVIIQPSDEASPGLPTAGISVLTIDCLGEIVSTYMSLAAELVRTDLEGDGLARFAGDLLAEHKLTPDGIRSTFLRAFRSRIANK
jgi:hypothetical protein